MMVCPYCRESMKSLGTLGDPRKPFKGWYCPACYASVGQF